jgi:hypothetical protein
MLIPLFFTLVHAPYFLGNMHGQVMLNVLLETGLISGQILLIPNWDTIYSRSIVGSNAYHDNQEVAPALLNTEV